MAEEIYRPSNHFVFITQPKNKKIILKWTFKNYSKLILGEEYKITSFHPLERCDWEIRFCKSKDKLFLCVDEKLNYHVVAHATISIIDCDEKEICCVERWRDIFISDELNITPDTYRTLNNQAKDTITLCIEFNIVNFDKLMGTVDKTDYIHWESESVTKVSEELKKFLLENHTNEVILKAKDGQIKTNQAILRARSPVFGKMFEHLMAEKKNEIILVDDVSKDALRTLIDFLHFEGVELRNDLPHLMELYYAADKYEILDLRNMCAKTMLFMLTEENVGGVLELAHRHSDSRLEKSCIHFIERRDPGAVIGSESWKKLKSSFPSLAVEVLEFCLQSILSKRGEKGFGNDYGIQTSSSSPGHYFPVESSFSRNPPNAMILSSVPSYQSIDDENEFLPIPVIPDDPVW